MRKISDDEYKRDLINRYSGYLKINNAFDKKNQTTFTIKGIDNLSDEEIKFRASFKGALKSGIKNSLKNSQFLLGPIVLGNDISLIIDFFNNSIRYSDVINSGEFVLLVMFELAVITILIDPIMNKNEWKKLNQVLLKSRNRLEDLIATGNLDDVNLELCKRAISRLDEQIERLNSINNKKVRGR